MTPESLKGSLKEEWYQCQGTSDSLKGEELEDQLKVPKGHAIFHISSEGRLDLTIFAERESLGIGKEPSYPVVSRILPRVKIDFGNVKGYEHCSSCAHILERHQKREGLKT